MIASELSASPACLRDGYPYLVTGRRMAKRILVVEDNDLNRKLFCEVLKSQGYAVEPVCDGRSALESARSFAPDLMIMDIQLPNVSGLELIEAAKRDADLKSIPVLAVTAYAGRGDEERIREAGADNYLSKPVSIGPFMKAVNALLEEKAATPA
jgi:two-component system, cell cycle response regulator DivK